MATLEALQARIKKLQAQAEAIAAKKSAAALNDIRALMAEHNLTTADIQAHVGEGRGRASNSPKSTQGKGVVRYRDPKTGATWTGHGRAPGWILAAKDRSRFLVGEAGASAGVRAASAKASGKGQPKGRQPARYRHPETGATWSGRGPAPAWLAGEKDRSRFLIDGNAAGTSSGAKKKVAAKKAARKSRA